MITDKHMPREAEPGGSAPWQAKGVADKIGNAVKYDLEKLGKHATVKAVRFIPSTLVRNADGEIQMIANTTVEVNGGSNKHAEVFESVVTMAAKPGRNSVKSVTTHALERAAAR